MEEEPNTTNSSNSNIVEGDVKPKRIMNPTGISRRPALRVINNEILSLKSNRNDQLKSISGFIRQRQILYSARLSHKRNSRARRLGIQVEDCPVPDPIWRKYRNKSVKIEDFDLAGCENEETLFEFGKEIVEQVESAEIGPDEGIPINSKCTLPRSFLLDSIHSTASLHCLHLQTKLNLPTNRTECPSPFERAKPLEGLSERFKSTMKLLMKVTKKRWISASEEADESDESSVETLDNFSDQDKEEIEPSKELSENDPDFSAILKKLLDIPSFLDPVPAYESNDPSRYGADALWSFDTSSLLAFGCLAEEFMTRMIESHLKSSPIYYPIEDNEDVEEFDSDELI